MPHASYPSSPGHIPTSCANLSIRNMDFSGKSEKEKAETKNTIAEEYKKDIRNISITVLKNRNGKARETAELKFYPAWSVFTDTSQNYDFEDLEED